MGWGGCGAWSTQDTRQTGRVRHKTDRPRGRGAGGARVTKHTPRTKDTKEREREHRPAPGGARPRRRRAAHAHIQLPLPPTPLAPLHSPRHYGESHSPHPRPQAAIGHVQLMWSTTALSAACLFTLFSSRKVVPLPQEAPVRLTAAPSLASSLRAHHQLTGLP